MKKNAALSGEEIQSEVEARLQEYKSRTPLEQYAIFMGKAQLLELALKNLLIKRYGLQADSLERRTLGQTKDLLAQHGVRPDIISFLQGVVRHRNNMAHEFLASAELTFRMANFSERMVYGDLFRAIYELEQIMIFCEWCEENDGWE